MIDNKKVKDSHQEGISRVRMRSGDLVKGQQGSMSAGWKHGKGHGGKSDSFDRTGDSITPRRG